MPPVAVRRDITAPPTTPVGMPGTSPPRPAGIACKSAGGGTCSAMEPYNSKVTLTVVPDALAGFGGWSGDCAGMEPSCTVTMSADKSVTAQLTPLNYMFLSSQLASPVTDL